MSEEQCLERQIPSELIPDVPVDIPPDIPEETNAATAAPSTDTPDNSGDDIPSEEPAAAESGPENIAADGNATVDDAGAGPDGKSGDADSTEAARAHQPVSAESTPSQEAGPEGQSGKAGQAETGAEVDFCFGASTAGEDLAPAELPARPKLWTMDELLEEYFPGATRVSGGVAAGLQRELRRRNRMAEKGY